MTLSCPTFHIMFSTLNTIQAQSVLSSSAKEESDQRWPTHHQFHPLLCPATSYYPSYSSR